MAKTTHAYLLAFATAYCFGGLACSSSNDPATPAGAGAPTTSAGAGNTTSGGAPTTAGGAPAAGAPATSAGAGGASDGGAPATGGASTAAGAGGAAPAGGASGVGTPLCSGLMTGGATPTVPAKGVSCSATDPQLCYGTCGPQGVGYKSETCTAGAYVEQSGCTFDATTDYGCYKVPTAVDASCPTTTIVASSPCTVAKCTTCTDATNHYFDSKMNLKVGYCTCPMAGASGTSKWSCASDTAWPCPTGKGCE